MAKGGTWHLKAISVLMAVLLWVFVTNESVILKQQMVSGVKLEAVNVSSGLVVAYSETVRVGIVGTPRTAEEIDAYVDLKDKGAGTHQVEVEVKPMQGTRVLTISPEEVLVEITENKEIVFPVSYEVEKPPSSGFQVAAVEISPASCVVRGDREGIDRVDDLVIRLDLSSAQGTSAIRSKVMAVDRNGLALTEVEVMPAYVQAYVVTQELRGFGEAAVTPIVTGAPAEGYEVVKVTVEPQKVTLLGKTQAVKGITEVQTKPLDIMGKDKSFQQEVDLTALSGIEAVPNKVTCLVEIREIPVPAEED
ncbi:MAG: hypothetical protein GXY50_10665 [Syntrophomonadaceae bacterium]|nr:hypothetical protein [Syntrophomonadaceae bacterium]